MTWRGYNNEKRKNKFITKTRYEIKCFIDK